MLQLFNDASCTSDIDNIRQQSKTTATSCGLSYEEFRNFIDDLASQQDMIKFWHQFVFVDCFAYIALFTGIRYRNWELRVGSIKQLAAVFSAYDRPTYQKLVPQHFFVPYQKQSFTN